jgi:hypothetical protein
LRFRRISHPDVDATLGVQGEPAMLAIVFLSMKAFSRPASSAKLARMAREYELVLVCPHDAAAHGFVSALRKGLPGRVVMAVLVDGVAHQQERELIDGILHDGNIPLIVTTRDPAASGVTDWIDADVSLSLPDGVPTLLRIDALR